MLAPDSPARALGFTDLDMRAVGRPGMTAPPIQLRWPTADATATDAVRWHGADCIALDSDTLASSVGLIAGTGVYVLDVPAGSPARTAGIRTGDVVLRIEGDPVTEPAELMARWSTAPAGVEVAFTLWRSQAALELRVHR